MNESPVFICEFSDGQTTRMTVFTPLGRLDVERGVRLARCAYYSRWHKQPPAIKAARFEQDGALLESYSAVDLEDIEERPIEDIDVKALHAERQQADEDLSPRHACGRCIGGTAAMIDTTFHGDKIGQQMLSF